MTLPDQETALRTLDQEPDCIAIFPLCPDFVVVGTYSLVQNCSDTNKNTRKGSLQILPFIPNSDISVFRKDFQCGIYYVHFHPRHTNILAVATSDAEVLFYEAVLDEEHGSRQPLTLAERGRVQVEEPHDDDGRLAIVTQCQFVDLEASDDTSTTIEGVGPLDVMLVVTTQFGNTKLVKVGIPGRDEGACELTTGAQLLQVHEHSLNLEAWTALTTSFPLQNELLVFSGGDDSQLLLSKIDLPAHASLSILDLEAMTPLPVLTDKRTHQAGIVTLSSLGSCASIGTGSLAPTEDEGILILTGSYDETLRLFLLQPPSATSARHKLQFLNELKMDGGVWRIILLDRYNAPASTSTDYILLIAGHTAGVFIVRLTVKRPAASDDSLGCDFVVEKSFQEHGSLVYAVAANADETISGRWNVISASFYDKKLCNWSWTDPKRR